MHTPATSLVTSTLIPTSASIGRYVLLLPAPLTHSLACQKRYRKYPTVGRIALNVIPAQASSVPCERLFSASKPDANQHRARIGPLRFEQVQVLKARWKEGAVDFAKVNAKFVEVYAIGEYEAMLAEDADMAELDKYMVPPAY